MRAPSRSSLDVSRLGSAEAPVVLTWVLTLMTEMALRILPSGASKSSGFGRPFHSRKRSKMRSYQSRHTALKSVSAVPANSSDFSQPSPPTIPTDNPSRLCPYVEHRPTDVSAIQPSSDLCPPPPPTSHSPP